MQLFGCFSAGQGSAACELLFVSAVQFSLLFSGHAGLLGLGGYASPPLVSYGQLVLFFGFIWIQPDNEAIGRTKLCFFNSRLTSVIVSLGHAGSTVILAAQLSFVNFVLREEFAFLFQTFSRNDLPGEAPPTRGRSVFKKRKEKRKKDREKKLLIFRKDLIFR